MEKAITEANGIKALLFIDLSKFQISLFGNLNGIE